MTAAAAAAAAAAALTNFRLTINRKSLREFYISKKETKKNKISFYFNIAHKRLLQ
jgi:hypothetical protein